VRRNTSKVRSTLKIQIFKEDTLAKRARSNTATITLPIEITLWEISLIWIIKLNLANNKPINWFQNNLPFMPNKTKELIPTEFNKITEFHRLALLIAPRETWTKKEEMILITNLSHLPKSVCSLDTLKVRLILKPPLWTILWKHQLLQLNREDFKIQESSIKNLIWVEWIKIKTRTADKIQINKVIDIYQKIIKTTLLLLKTSSQSMAASWENHHTVMLLQWATLTMFSKEWDLEE